MNVKKLYRSPRGRVIAGVASGLANYFAVDVVIFRLIFIFTALFGGSGFIIYLILWISLPEEPVDYASYTDYVNDAPPEADSRKSPFEKNTPAIKEQSKTAAIIIGGVLIVFGLLFLLKEWIPRIDWGFIWPAILILAGVLVLSTATIKMKNNE